MRFRFVASIRFFRSMFISGDRRALRKSQHPKNVHRNFHSACRTLFQHIKCVYFVFFHLTSNKQATRREADEESLSFSWILNLNHCHAVLLKSHKFHFHFVVLQIIHRRKLSVTWSFHSIFLLPFFGLFIFTCRLFSAWHSTRLLHVCRKSGGKDKSSESWKWSDVIKIYVIRTSCWMLNSKVINFMFWPWNNNNKVKASAGQNATI